MTGYTRARAGLLRPILLIPASIATLVWTFAAPAAQSLPAGWYKGNTHTHTLNSDGDSTPDDVARWYREHRYQFLVLTDHNFLTDVDALNALHGAGASEATYDFTGAEGYVRAKVTDSNGQIAWCQPRVVG